MLFGTMRRAITIMMALMLALSAFASVAVAQDVTGEEEEQADPDIGVTIEEITSDPERYYGTTVTVSGEVDEVIGPRSFTFQTGGGGFFGLFGGGDELLVLSAADIPATGATEPDILVEEGLTEEEAFPEEEDGAFAEDEVLGEEEQESLISGNTVQVRGVVEQFLIADITTFEDELGTDLDDQALEEFDGEPVIIADVVRFDPIISPAADLAVNLEDLVEEPENYLNTTLTVAGQIGEIVNPTAFTMVEDEQEILVVGATEFFRGLREEQYVLVSGAVQQLVVIDIEEEFGIDLDEEGLSEWEDEPVLVALDVTTENAAEAAINLEDVIEDTDEFIGQRVSVGGEINDVVGRQAFTIETDDGQDILVVGAQDIIPPALFGDAFAAVTGVVLNFDLVTVEEELGEDLDDATFDEFEGDPVIVADNIIVVR